MKTPVIAIAASAAFFSSIGYAEAGSYEDYFGGQEGVNKHLQGSINDMQEFDHHLQGSINDDRKRISSVESEAASNTAWNDRQEGVIRQNRGRLDEHGQKLADVKAHTDRNTSLGESNQREVRAVQKQANGNTERSIGNQQAIGFLQETDAQLSSAIQQGQKAHAVTDKRSINNAGRLDGAEGAIRETNQQVTTDRQDSIQRDQVIANQVDYNEQVNAAYRRQSAQSFQQHEQAINANAQAIASERHDRREADEDLQAGIASAIAAGSHIMDASYQGLQMSIAGGSYRGASAASLAIGGAFNSRTFGHISISNDSRGHQALGANINVKF